MKLIHPTAYPFDLFWQAYKKKVGAKANCEKKWYEALTEEDRQKIMSGINAYCLPFVQTNRVQYLPYPETFLNQRRWENEDEWSVDKPLDPEQKRLENLPGKAFLINHGYLLQSLEKGYHWRHDGAEQEGLRAYEQLKQR